MGSSKRSLISFPFVKLQAREAFAAVISFKEKARGRGGRAEGLGTASHRTLALILPGGSQVADLASDEI